MVLYFEILFLDLRHAQVGSFMFGHEMIGFLHHARNGYHTTIRLDVCWDGGPGQRLGAKRVHVGADERRWSEYLSMLRVLLWWAISVI